MTPGAPGPDFRTWANPTARATQSTNLLPTKILLYLASPGREWTPTGCWLLHQ